MAREEEIEGGTIVGSNVKLTGVLKDVNDIIIHGRVEGEVISEKNVVVTEKADIKGPITADSVVVNGKISGAVTARTKFELLPGGNVNGSIATKDLVIQSGAVFNGKCLMMQEKTIIPVEQAKAEKDEKSKEETEEKPKEEATEKSKEKEYELD